MHTPEVASRQLLALALQLAARRDAVLQAWRTAVQADPTLTTASSLPRSQFNDHIPGLLDGFGARVKAWPRRESADSGARRKDDAASHGLQRWQQGYHLREVTREWGHLQLCLADELTDYSLAHADLDPAVMPAAWRALAELCGQGVSESATQYFQIQQEEAAGHVREMERHLAEVRELGSSRVELFRQAAHDLRGNVGVVRNATAGLARDEVPEPMRDDLLRLLQRSVSSLHGLLDEVMDLSRLEAGQEARAVQAVDAGVVLTDLVEQLRPLASERGLYLRADGPSAMRVHGDGPKIRRIVQNLVMNGVKYTRAGGVTVSWGDSRNNDARRWMVCVQDTGPGFDGGAGSPMAEVLKDATVESREVDAHAPQGAPGPAPAEPPHQPVRVAGPAADEERGEGIGLSIVKRLCELLDASVELESLPGAGTTFRIVLPRRYDAG